MNQPYIGSNLESDFPLLPFESFYSTLLSTIRIDMVRVGPLDEFP